MDGENTLKDLWSESVAEAVKDDEHSPLLSAPWGHFEREKGGSSNLLSHPSIRPQVKIIPAGPSKDPFAQVIFHVPELDGDDHLDRATLAIATNINNTIALSKRFKTRKKDVRHQWEIFLRYNLDSGEIHTIDLEGHAAPDHQQRVQTYPTEINNPFQIVKGNPRSFTVDATDYLCENHHNATLGFVVTPGGDSFHLRLETDEEPGKIIFTEAPRIIKNPWQIWQIIRQELQNITGINLMGGLDSPSKG